jgi:hypothetical protein
MGWIGIGVGLVMAGLSSFGLIESRPAITVLLVIAVFLISNGVYEVWGKPRIFLERRIRGWLVRSNWSVRIDKQPGAFFWIWAKDQAARELAVSRHKENKGILVFTALVPLEGDWVLKLAKLGAVEQCQLVEDIKTFLATKDMAYVDVKWPLEKVTVQDALALDDNISRYLVDLKAKKVINAVIGAKSIVRRAIGGLAK